MPGVKNWFLCRNLSIETLAAILDEAPLKQISTRMKATPIRHNLNIKQRSYEGYAYFIYPIIEPGTGILHGQNVHSHFVPQSVKNHITVMGHIS